MSAVVMSYTQPFPETGLKKKKRKNKNNRLYRSNLHPETISIWSGQGRYFVAIIVGTVFAKMWIKRSSAKHFGDGVMNQRNIRAQKGKKHIETMYYTTIYRYTSPIS